MHFLAVKKSATNLQTLVQIPTVESDLDKTFPAKPGVPPKRWRRN
jgi:hypothetical protein